MKNLKSIKLLCLFIVISCCMSTITAQNQIKIDLSLKNSTLKELISQIEKKTDYTFIFKNSISLEQKVSYEFKQQSIQKILETTLHDKNIEFEITGKQIILKLTNSTKENKRRITGTVVDEGNNPLIGVTIILNGSSNGTTTDVSGKFSLELESKAQQEIKISYLGYKAQRIQIGSKNNYNISLSEDTQVLNEVIVVGYGVQKKSVVTAAISRVTAADMEKTIPTRIENVLKGKTSGVTITAGSGQPGAGSVVRIRGTGTINDSNPLYIVDGMAVGGIDYLNPTDIESVEILKDAASAAVYGARAANGVVLVTTKSGKKGKTTVNYDLSYGVQNPWKKRSVLNAPWYQTIINESLINSGKEPIFSAITTDLGTDWQKEVFNSNAPIQNHQVSINGGTDASTYFLSLGYIEQQGIVGGNFNRSNYNRWSVRSNNIYKLIDAEKERTILNKLTLGVSAGYTRAKSTGITENSLFYSPLGSALLVSPTMKLYSDDPSAILLLHPTAVTNKNRKVYSIPDASFNEIINPVASLESPAGWNYSDRIVSTFWGELNILKDLKFKSSYGIDLNFGNYDSWSKPYYLGSGGAASSINSSVSSSLNRGFTWQLENTLTYTKSFADKHNLTILLGQSATQFTYRYLSGTDYGLQGYDPHTATIDFCIGDRTNERVSGGKGYSTMASYFGRIDYNYAEKYIFQATVRRDGSSNFGPNNKWANFPSFSLGWNITNEKFMQNKPSYLSSLKLRGSWGKNGNQNIGQFRYVSTVVAGSNYTFGNSATETIITGVRPAALSNADLKWEESEQTDIGLDMRLFENSLSLGLDYFYKRTNGMLMTMPIAYYAGTDAPTGNVGDMENSGVEFDVTYKFKIADASFGLSGNTSYLNNKLIKLGNQSGFLNFDNIQSVGTASRAENGDVFPFFYGYKTNGIFQTQSEVDSYTNSNGVKLLPNAVQGDVRFVDLNKDGVIDDNDRTKIGKGMPDFTFGLTLSADWRGLDLNAFFQGVAGSNIYDATRRIDLVYANQPAWILGRWTGPGTSDKLPRVAVIDNNNNWRSSDLYIKDGSYLRMKSLQLGYSLPKKMINKLYLQKIRIYMSAENLLTFTKYDGFDPEIASGGTSLGIDMGCYPQARTFSLGANITF